MANGLVRDFPLPALRPELRLHRGPCLADGAPTWTLEDPAGGRFFSLGWREYALLSAWPGGRATVVALAAGRSLGQTISLDQVREFHGFLDRHHLIRRDGPGAGRRLATAERAGRHAWTRRLLHGYLFFRIPLIDPGPWLDALRPVTAAVLSRRFLYLVALTAALGLYLTARQWDLFQATFLHLFTPLGFAGWGLALAITKIAHEFGHACVARHFGCRVPSMGIAFMVFMPVLFTDTTEVWRLRARAARLAVGAAGVAAELAIAAFALLAWSLAPDGVGRTVAFLLATATWTVTLAINLNPFMRFDGYFLLSDALRVPNLQARAFALLRWRLREALFGFGEPAPELLAPPLARGLILYAGATWLYRAALVAGIAVLLYQMAFKLAGAILMVLEVSLLIGWPVITELRAWARRRRVLRWNRAVVRTLGLLALGAALLLVPWPSTLSVPALLAPARHTRLYAPEPARVTMVTVDRGQRVEAGAVLVRLESPELEYAVIQARTAIESLSWQLDHRATRLDVLANTLVLEQQRAQRQSELAGLEQRRDRLVVRAPFSGLIVDLAQDLRPGQWVGPSLRLVEMLEPAGRVADGFVSEAALERVEVGAAGQFHFESSPRTPIPVRLAMIDTAAVPTLPSPHLASLYGGPIAVREQAGAGNAARVGSEPRLVPEDALYRLRFTIPAEMYGRDTLALSDAGQVARGWVVFTVASRSLIGRLYTSVAVIVIRESGF